jgi:hypothetical protein
MAQSITLQTSDNNVQESDVLGRLSFAASSESSGSDAILIGASIYAMAESDFTEISNATSIIFATSTSESAIAKLKISSQGHFLPLLNKTYDIGASGTKFRNVYAENGNFENITISNLSDPYEILYITDASGTVSSTDLLKVDIANGDLKLNGDIVGTGDINISGTITATSGNFSSLRVNGINVSLSGHTHVASDIINFSEAVDDRVNDLLIEGTGVQLTYNDSGNTLTLNNLHTEINELSLEPQGFVNRLDSIISFNDSTRTFTIQPSGSSYDVYIEGVKFTKTAPETVVIGSGTALNYLHFDVATKQLHNKTTEFNFDIDVPIAYIHWNADINQSTFFGEERHGIRMDSSTHKWIHNTFGMQYINGLSIGNYILLGNGSSNSHAQISISDGTLYQEDIIINIADSDNGVEFTQQLSPIAYIPTYYHSGSTGQWVRGSGTPYPVKYDATRAQYNLLSGGTWTTPNVPNNHFFAMWIVATNDINDPILAIVGQKEHGSLNSAENNNNWSDLNLANIPASEIKPLYRLIFRTNNSYTNTPKSSLQSILDLRVSVSSTINGVTQNDHGLLFGLGDDDHAQYVHINEARTISANHTFTNGLTINDGLLSATSGNFTSLSVNNTGVSLSGHTHTSSNITDFNSSVSGILPVKNIVAGSGISINNNSGIYTINSTATGSSSTSVIEYNNVSNFPSSGVGSTIYISTDTGRIYRWASSAYQELGPVSYAPIGSDSRWDLFLPPAPTGLAVTPGNTQVTLAWNAPTVSIQTPITDYTVQYSANSGSSWTTFTRSASTSTTATVTGLTNGQAYVLRVAAVNGIGTGAYSTASSAVTPVAFSPSFISGLQLWLDASDASTLYNATSGGSLVAADGGVARWEDKSGNGRHATQATSGSRPLRRAAGVNGLGALEFDGTNDWLSTSASVFSALTSLSWFAVVKNDDSGANNRAVFGDRVNGDDGGLFFTKIGTSNILYSRGSANASTRVDVSEAVSFPTTTTMASMVTTSSSGTARRNGAPAGTNTTTTASVAYRNATAIGNSLDEDGQPSILWWDGLVCELVFYNAALSDAHRSTVESYLMTKWGIS